MRALFTTNHLENFSGSELVLLEAAEHFSARGWDCLIAANWISEPMQGEIARSQIPTTLELGRLNAFSYDFVWVQHLTAPLLNYEVGPIADRRTRFAFVHLSPFLHLEANSSTFEDILADVVVANSPETAERLKEFAIPGSRIRIFSNAAPARFWMSRKPPRETPKRIHVVSNHLPPELAGALDMLRPHAKVVHFGRGGDVVKRITPDDIARADVVITIGKTVPYALASRTPVYVYDHLGGPGYLDGATIDAAADHNFSGRCCRIRRDARAIVRDLFEGYAQARRFYSCLDESALHRFRLEGHLEAIAGPPGMPNRDRAGTMAERRALLNRDQASAELIASTYGKAYRGRPNTRKVGAKPGLDTNLGPSNGNRGKPKMAVVVLAVGAPAELRGAVASLLSQPVPLEIVVVNSGGGDPLKVMRKAASHVRIVTSRSVLWPGAARNLGIVNSKAPIVAFLAADCRADVNWAAARIARHGAGNDAVASALLNSHTTNLFAWANHLFLFCRRLPCLSSRDTLNYGASYARRLFDRHGLFREDIRAGEDTDFNRRLPQKSRPIWAPEVRTIHLAPTTFRGMITDQYVRGKRSAQALKALGLEPTRSSTSMAYVRVKQSIRLSLRGLAGPDRVFAIAAWPLLLSCGLAQALGMRRGRQMSGRVASSGMRAIAREKQA